MSQFVMWKWVTKSQFIILLYFVYSFLVVYTYFIYYSSRYLIWKYSFNITVNRNFNQNWILLKFLYICHQHMIIIVM